MEYNYFLLGKWNTIFDAGQVNTIIRRWASGIQLFNAGQVEYNYLTLGKWNTIIRHDAGEILVFDTGQVEYN